MSDNEDSVELAKSSQVHVSADGDEDTDQGTSHHFKSFKEYKDRELRGLALLCSTDNLFYWLDSCLNPIRHFWQPSGLV